MVLPIQITRRRVYLKGVTIRWSTYKKINQIEYLKIVHIPKKFKPVDVKWKNPFVHFSPSDKTWTRFLLLTPIKEIKKKREENQFVF